MAADELSAPLGQHKTSKESAAPVSPATALAAVLGAVTAVFVGWVILMNDPLGGEPTAVASLNGGFSKPADGGPAAPVQIEKAPTPEAKIDKPPAAAEASGVQAITIIDGSTGKRQEVQIASPADGKRGIGDPKLLEPSRHGLIPKIAADGTRAADAYARPRPAAAKSDLPLIAIVVDGLGIGTSATADAIAKLPGPVTLAFAPYGTEVERAVARARETGHEVILQVSMEPYDYPDNDPGPQTLLTSIPTEQNIDRLYWMMSRFQGYVGIANYMGARFTATEAALTPILRETAKRGLIYFDQVASPRSLAGQIANSANLPFAKSDVVLDAVPTAADIGKALTRLEGAARLNGVAVGVISALPVSINRITQWAKSAESRGFMLVPISVAALRSKQS